MAEQLLGLTGATATIETGRRGAGDHLECASQLARRARPARKRLLEGEDGDVVVASTASTLFCTVSSMVSLVLRA